ncbi:MAG: aminotransferase class I/II-fold pyridoxal phosphate-dependent enzyme [Anaerolineae bacterium]|nr:aminotransferase class I/II-fold pyridoxal phosphate-dependent enzyme [Anaerolineae bacterium]
MTTLHPFLAHRLIGTGTSVFSEMSALAAKHHAINLGQGFPDFPGPPWIKAAAEEAIAGDINQYAIAHGAPVLRQALAAHYSPRLGRDLDPNRDVVVTSGATEAIFASVLGLVNPGDEVVIFEPFYDSYVPSIDFAGGVPRYVPLRQPDADHAEWWYDAAELEAACGPRTKLILVNTPHNPTGKVFTRAELQHIAGLAQRWNTLVLSDEVYEYLTFDDAEHISIATLPGMWERTLTVSSAGKTFSLTGWKIGWVIAPPSLNAATRGTHQFIVFCSATPLQAGIAAALSLADDHGYYDQFRTEYSQRRDVLLAALADAGLPAFAPRGTYFALADIRHLPYIDDVAFCRALTVEAGVTAIPPTAFYSEGHRELGRHLARFAFCKRVETLEEAAHRLHRWASPTAQAAGKC